MPRVCLASLWLGNRWPAQRRCCSLGGCQVRAPGAIETNFIDGAKRRITVGGRSDVNPLPASAENIHAGQRNFASYCMVCHGLDGQNTGRAIRGQNVAARAAAQFARGAGLHRRPIALDHRERNLSLRECPLRETSSTTTKSGNWCSTSAIFRRREA